MNAVIRPEHPFGEHTAIHWSTESIGDSASPFGASYITVGHCYCGEETCGKCEGCGNYIWSDDMSHVIELCNGCALAKEEAQMQAIEATYTGPDLHQALWGDPLPLSEAPHYDEPIAFTDAELAQLRMMESV